MNKLSLDDLEVSGKKVFLRVDFNVPLDENLNISDATRIDRTLPTIRSLLDRGAKVAICSHLGRPKQADPKLSLSPVAKYLANVLDKKVRFSSTVYGQSAKMAIDALSNGECLLFENIRFFPEEEQNDAAFSAKIAENFDFYVNDAFGSSHRAHASTVGVAAHFKNAAAGYLMQKELSYLTQVLARPKRPFLAILGGAKVKDKIKLVVSLLQKTDALLIGGGMAYTFLHLQGKKIGKSILDKDNLDVVEKALNFAQKHNHKILLPVDHKVAKHIEADESEVKTVEEIDDEMTAFDIGPKTVEIYKKEVLASKMLFWNGPMGVFEKPAFSAGTIGIANVLKVSKCVSIIGGGDSLSAIKQAKAAEYVSHISTGGGASLELLEGAKLPGVEALSDKK